MTGRVLSAALRVPGAGCRVPGASCRVLLVVWAALVGAADAAGAQTLRQEIDAIAAMGGVGWVSYRVPMVGAQRRMCCFDSSAQASTGCCGRCQLERGDGIVLSDVEPSSPAASRIVVEAPSEMRVFVRVENRVVSRIRTFSLDCDVDAGGATVTALENVAVNESVTWLATVVTLPSDAADSRNRLQMSALSALALHPGTAAADRLVAFARDDARARVRGQALFWLAERAGSEAVRTLGNAIDADPELEVKRQAVFALSRLPRAEGVPLLIQLARTHRLSEIRRQAMFWLGQSKDPRAVDFFEQILRLK